MPTIQDFLDHPIESLERAIHLRKQIEALQKRLGELFGSNPPAFAGAQVFETKRRGRPKGKKRSAEVRARMAAAQQARWATKKGIATPAPVAKGQGAAPPAQPAPAPKKKGGMSAEGRARIIAAQKARWAKVRGEKAAAPAKAAIAPKKKKGTISPEGLARIKAAQKLRWAKFKKAKK
jgi:hypothetical protein